MPGEDRSKPNTLSIYPGEEKKKKDGRRRRRRKKKVLVRGLAAISQT
jgi:hypothetical protein